MESKKGGGEMNLPLYPKVPHMKCDAGCGECCTFASCSEAELEAITKYIAEKGIIPLKQGARCPLYLEGNCSIYPVRPWICRMFGHAMSLQCSRGYNVYISQKKEQAYSREYVREHKPSRFVHEVLYDMGEVKALVGYALDEK